MHKGGKWANQIIDLQEADGNFGYFHSLSKYHNSPITTEQALRRLERLGYTISDDCIQKAVRYMNDCLTGKNEIPDRKENTHDWSIFTSLMLAAWVRRFTSDNFMANQIATQWSQIITSAFSTGEYEHNAYVKAYQDILGTRPKGARLIDFVHFYPLSLLRDTLDSKTENAMIWYVLRKTSGIYYVYDGKISILPSVFQSKNASYYLAAIELLAAYECSKHQLNFVVTWLIKNRNINGKWDMGKGVNDKIYFPLSDDWRKKEAREADCTERIEKLLFKLSNPIIR